MKLHKKIFITGTMEILTGIHIGDSKDNVDIGGVDNPVVRRKDNNQPYIPGSSLKGKMRSLLETAIGKNSDNKFKNDGNLICDLFGSLDGDNNHKGRPSRILVRDANLTTDSAKKLENSTNTDMPFTEVKFENSILRIEGKAQNPRQQERVPAGAMFDVEFVINIVSENGENSLETKEGELLKLFYSGIELLQDDYLGGSGSRGYGKVKFTLNTPVSKSIEDYKIPATA